jgi:hypothetical protein
MEVVASSICWLSTSGSSGVAVRDQQLQVLLMNASDDSVVYVEN